MHHLLTLAALTALLSVSTSTATYFVDNYCTFPMYLQSTSTPADGPVPLITMTANTTNAYSEVMRGPEYSINALTISRTPDMAVPMQATYHQTTQGPPPGYNFYALSTIWGDPLMAEGFQLLTMPDGFGLNCPPRSPGQSCAYTYSPNNPSGEHAVFYESDLEDLRLTLCRYNFNGTADS